MTAARPDYEAARLAARAASSGHGGADYARREREAIQAVEREEEERIKREEKQTQRRFAI